MIIASVFLGLLCCQQNTAEFAGKIDVDVSNEDFDLRRLRLGVEGTLDDGSNYIFSVNNDLDEGESSLHELLISFDHAWGIMEIGYFKEPFGLENSHSSHQVNFLERSSATMLAADHSIGFANYLTLSDDAHLFWGIYRNAITARFTTLLLSDTDEDLFWHIGSSFAVRKSDEFFQGAEILLFDIESLYQRGAFTAQAESQALLIDETESTSFTIQASYMFNGENREYNINRSIFDFPEQGGGVEVAVRATHVDMIEYLPLMDVIDDYAFDVSYYLNESSKLQFEIGRGSDGFSDDSNTFALRYHLHW
ncbi:MAG TPA: hypothetical protein EYN86_05245 [Planctomycetes bacterium]|nr:hypothetical protein [Planctomycetota bacterium]